MTFEERIQLETVNHRARLAWAFLIFVLFVVGVVFWLTETPKRWVPVIAIPIAIGFYFSLR